MDFFVDHVIFSHGNFWWDFGVSILEVFRDGFSMGFILKFGKYIISNVLKIFLDTIDGLDVFIDIKMFIAVILDNMKFDDNVIGGRATVLEPNKISISFNVSHLSFGWHVNKSIVVREISEDFGTVTVEVLEWDGFVVEVSLGVVGEFEDH